MSKNKTAIKKRDKLGSAKYFIVLGIIILLGGFVHLLDTSQFRPFKPGQCFLWSKDNQVSVKITEIREDERDGVTVIYDVHDESKYPYTNSTGFYSKKEFTKLFKESYNCEVHDLKSRITGMEENEQRSREEYHRDRDYWRHLAEVSYGRRIRCESRLKSQSGK